MIYLSGLVSSLLSPLYLSHRQHDKSMTWIRQTHRQRPHPSTRQVHHSTSYVNHTRGALTQLHPCLLLTPDHACDVCCKCVDEDDYLDDEEDSLPYNEMHPHPERRVEKPVDIVILIVIHSLPPKDQDQLRSPPNNPFSFVQEGCEMGLAWEKCCMDPANDE